jgi:hypothetical protein
LSRKASKFNRFSGVCSGKRQIHEKNVGELTNEYKTGFTHTPLYPPASGQECEVFAGKSCDPPFIPPASEGKRIDFPCLQETERAKLHSPTRLRKEQKRDKFFVVCAENHHENRVFRHHGLLYSSVEVWCLDSVCRE